MCSSSDSSLSTPSPPVLRGRGQGEGDRTTRGDSPSPPTPLPRSTGGEGGTHTPSPPGTPGGEGRVRGDSAARQDSPSPLPLSPGVPGAREPSARSAWLAAALTAALLAGAGCRPAASDAPAAQASESSRRKVTIVRPERKTIRRE